MPDFVTALPGRAQILTRALAGRVAARRTSESTGDDTTHALLQAKARSRARSVDPGENARGLTAALPASESPEPAPTAPRLVFDSPEVPAMPPGTAEKPAPPPPPPEGELSSAEILARRKKRR